MIFTKPDLAIYRFDAILDTESAVPVLSFLNHLLCKIAINTQAEQNVNIPLQRNVYTFSGSPDSVSNMASKR